MQKPPVLIVEDQKGLRNLMEALLAQEGHPVVTADNGTGAIAALLRSPPPPLVLLDLVMPQVDGLEVLAWIAAHPDIAEQTRVIVITTTHVEAMKAQHPVLASPFVAGCLEKPLVVEKMLELVRALLPKLPR